MHATKSSRNLSFVLTWLLASQLMQAAWAAQPTVQALSKGNLDVEPLLLDSPKRQKIRLRDVSPSYWYAGRYFVEPVNWQQPVLDSRLLPGNKQILVSTLTTNRTANSFKLAQFSPTRNSILTSRLLRERKSVSYFRHSLELEGEEPLLLSPPLEKTPYWPYSLY